MDAQVYFFNYCNQMDLNQSSMAAWAATNEVCHIASYIILSYNLTTMFLFNYFIFFYLLCPLIKIQKTSNVRITSIEGEKKGYNQCKQAK